MTRILLPPTLQSLINDLKRRIEQLERGKAAIGTAAGLTTSVQAGPSGSPISGAIELDGSTALGQVAVTESGQKIAFAWNDPSTNPGDLIVRGSSGLMRLGIGSPKSVLSVARLGNYAVTALGLGPLAYYRLNEASGLTMADATTNARNGTYAGSGVTYHVAPATGDSDYAVAYDNVNGYSQVANLLPNGDFSVAFFFKTSMASGFKGDTSAAALVSTWDGNANTGAANFISLNMETGYNHPLGTISWRSKHLYFATPSAYNNGAWHHVVYTYSIATGTVDIYVDGTLQASGSATGDNPAGPANLAFAATTNNGASPAPWYNGDLDEVSFYTYVLTAAQVSNLYAQYAGIAVNTPAWEVQL